MDTLQFKMNLISEVTLRLEFLCLWCYNLSHTDSVFEGAKDTTG